MGHLYKRKRRRKDGSTWENQNWTYKFYCRGKQVYYDTNERNKRKALDIAKQYEVEMKGGQDPKEFDKVTLKQLKDLLILDYATNKKKSIDTVRYRLKPLEKFFEDYRAIEVTTKKVQEYIKERQDSDKANATINRELAALKRMFNLGVRHSPPLVKQVPYVPMLQENNAREGFFRKGEYEKLLKHLPQYLKPVIMMAYYTGMRKKEILSLEWKDIDFKNKNLRVYDTKTKEPRVVPMLGPLMEELKWLKKKAVKEGSELPYVFLNSNGTDRIKDFRGAWFTACEDAKIGRKLFHDFRRTAVRNMVRAGVPEKIAMSISGHKTRSIFDRYNIVDEADLNNAMEQVGKYLDTVKEPAKVIEMPKAKTVRKGKGWERLRVE